MFEINRNKIKLTKSDTASLEFVITQLDDKEYIPLESDRITLTVRKNVNSPTEEIKLEAKENKYFIFTPNDTKDLEPRLYVYDVQLASDEYCYTVKSGTFQLLPEVTI